MPIFNLTLHVLCFQFVIILSERDECTLTVIIHIDKNKFIVPRKHCNFAVFALLLLIQFFPRNPAWSQPSGNTFICLHMF